MGRESNTRKDLQAIMVDRDNSKLKGLDIKAEMELIEQKKSSLSSSRRQLVKWACELDRMKAEQKKEEVK